jgi:hypothetical protein
MTELRKRLNPKHPVVGEGYRLLEDCEALRPGDQTACVSCLINPEADQLEWVGIGGWADAVKMQTPIGVLLGPNSDDADARERVFRRKK